MSPVTRRGLLGLGAALVAGAGGACAGWLTAPARRLPVARPQKRAPVLEAELVRERDLIARLDATATAQASLAGRIAVLRSDHSNHLAALEALLSAAGVSPTVVPTPDTGSSTASGDTASADPAPPPLTSVGDLLAVETAAATAAAAASRRLDGSAAATLASISASESSHAAWLS